MKSSSRTLATNYFLTVFVDKGFGRLVFFSVSFTISFFSVYLTILLIFVNKARQKVPLRLRIQTISRLEVPLDSPGQ